MKPSPAVLVLDDMAESVGKGGEQLVARELERRGFRLLGQNLRLGRGEVDLLARRGTTLLLVEVKTRAGSSGPQPEASVGRHKRHQLLGAAAVLARRYPELSLTIAVAAVHHLPGKEPSIRWYLDPF